LHYILKENSDFTLSSDRQTGDKVVLQPLLQIIMVNAPVSNSTVMKNNRMVLNFISYIFKITYILYVNSGLVVTTGVRCFGFDSTFCKFYACSCILTWIEKNQESGLLVALITWIEKNRESGFLVARIPGLKKIEKLDFWSFEYLDS
jgi:hypothetical protein